MTEDKITDMDDDGYITDEPEVEEPIGDIEEPVVEKPKRKYTKKPKVYRKQIPKFPLDHSILCSCGYQGTVGFRQLNCPKCNERLIRPEDVERIDLRLRRRPRG